MIEEATPAPNRGGRRPGVWTFTTPEAFVRWRTQNNFSRAEVARRLGVAFSAVERWEKGGAVALPETQRRLADLMCDAPIEEKSFKVEPPTAASAGDVAVLGASAIVTEYIRHSKLSPEALVKLTRELRDALR